MTSDYEFTLSLGFRHPDVDPAWITRSLALQPQHVWRRGEQRRDAEGEVLDGTRRESYWICEIAATSAFAGDTVELEAGLAQALKTLRQSMSFLQHLHHSGGAAELFISVYAHKEFRISLLAEEASLLGRLGITLTIEIKPQASTTADAERH